MCRCRRAYTIYRWINSFWAIAATSEGMVAVKDLQNACHAPHFLLIRDWILGQSFQQVCWSCWYGSCHPDPPCSVNIWSDWGFLLHIKLGRVHLQTTMQMSTKDEYSQCDPELQCIHGPESEWNEFNGFRGRKLEVPTTLKSTKTTTIHYHQRWRSSEWRRRGKKDGSTGFNPIVTPYCNCIEQWGSIEY